MGMDTTSAVTDGDGLIFHYRAGLLIHGTRQTLVSESAFRPERKHTAPFGSDGWQQQRYHGRRIIDVISRGVWEHSPSTVPRKR